MAGISKTIRKYQGEVLIEEEVYNAQGESPIEAYSLFVLAQSDDEEMKKDCKDMLSLSQELVEEIKKKKEDKTK